MARMLGDRQRGRVCLRPARDLRGGDLAIEVKDDTLTVSAQRERTEETSDEGFYRFERRYGTFARAVGLPQGVNQEQISARDENGVLEIRVPKPQEQKPRPIEFSKTLESTSSEA